MKSRILMVILFGPFVGVLLLGRPLFSQTCHDDEAMVKSYEKTLADLVSAVRRENLNDFQKDYHQQSCLSDLNLSLGIVDAYLVCLKKEAKDSTATPAQVSAARSKLQAYAKLKAALVEDRNSLKGAKDPKTAKALIEKFNISP